MSSTIRHKRLTTPAAVPSAGDMAVAELAINLADRRLFSKDAANTIFELGAQPTFQRTGLVATANQTVVTLASTATFVLSVEVNGVLMRNPDDYTFASGNKITFVAALTLGDQVQISYVE